MGDCLVNRFDHIEVATKDIHVMEKLFGELGFVCTQRREHDEGLQKLLVQGQIRVLLTQGRPGTFACDYVEKHGEGVCNIAYTVSDAKATWEKALLRGAENAQKYFVQEDPATQLKVGFAAIRSFGDVRATFVERSGAAFDVHACFAPGFEFTGQENLKDLGLLSIDHLTNNVEMGKMEHWAYFYKQIYGWVEARYFDIKASQTGLHSKVLQSPDGAVKIPINEATEAKSQIQEFIDMHKGAGVQHIALTTNNIRQTVKSLKDRGFKFLEMPKTYYDDVVKRVQNVKEPIPDLAELDILVDGDEKGYLLQIFTENQIGPLFFEIIQRRGNNGFGEGNFKALFEAIERDQIKRGVLQAV